MFARGASPPRNLKPVDPGPARHRDLRLRRRPPGRRLDDETGRLHEDTPYFASPRFDAHAAFLMGEGRAWTRSRFGVDLPAGRTAVFGVSAGGELALALGLILESLSRGLAVHRLEDTA
ncbi:MAG: hypothetical protein IT452_16385 [Planctomycetia bacterium]|nr:hypothetical protein [Planctomycetia bacterium]